MRFDCHQHIWPSRLVAALRARTEEPRLEGWTLLQVGGETYEVDSADHDVCVRRAREVDEGTDCVMLSLSSPLGIEHLPGPEARELIAIWHASALALGDPFALWAATPVSEFDLEGLAEILPHDQVVGLQLPATCLSSPAAIVRMKPVLDLVEASGKPLLIHPGPTRTAADTPSWWSAVVSYPAQLQEAWFAWHAAGRAQHGVLRVAFVGLAGLAPLHHERLVARGGDFSSVDPRVFYETSSYGTRAVDAMVRVVGVDPIVHGSDRPYAEPTDPGLGDAFSHAMFFTNPHHLLKGTSR